MRRALLLGVLAAVLAKKYNTNAKRDAAKINLHFIPHTHDDVGWLKTVDQYYVGSNNTIQQAGVQYVLDSLIYALQQNPDRKFVYVEQAFFQRWYVEQTAAMQATVKGLVSSGQLELINGGWCMHDEANPDYVSMIDQTTLGSRWIASEFGPAGTPKVTWQIDPFGHSSTQGSLLSSPLSGYGAVFWARISYDDRANRVSDKSMEWIWKPSPSLGDTALTFASTFRFHYSAPNCASNDISNDGAQPINDDPNLEDNNVADVVNCILDDLVGNYVPAYLGNDILVTMGDDFNYMNALMYFKNTDKIISYINQLNGSTLNAFYSTPSQYLQAKLNSGISFPTKTDDLFPYADGPHSYWTGYFTSRASFKRYVRESTNVHQNARQLQFLTTGAQDLGPSNPLYLLERAVGVTQHHDAVAGTAKQHVTWDYERRLSTGRVPAFKSMSQAFTALTGYQTSAFAWCELSNATVCPPLESGTQQVVAVYNGQAQTRLSAHIRLPVGLSAGVTSFSVADAGGNVVVAQLLPLSAEDESVRAVYSGSNTTTINWLVFTAPTVPAMGYTVFFVTPVQSVEEAPLTYISIPKTYRLGTGLRGQAGSITLNNSVIFLTFDSTTGQLATLSNTKNGISVPLTQEWLWYNASVGNSVSGQASGAYIFRPNSSTPFPIPGGASITILTGPVVSEARQVAGSWVSQVIRLWNASTSVEADWTVGPIDIDDFQGKEVIARYSTGWASNATWYTDSNCREMQMRIRNYRPTWTLNVTEPVSGNYFPVNCGIQLNDETSGNTLTVITDRSQGGSSMQDGALELMVHRRLLVDDGRGVGEPLDEFMWSDSLTGLIVRGTHIISVDTAMARATSRVNLQQNALFPPTVMFAPYTGSVAQWISTYKPSASGLSAPLPANVHLLTVQSQNATTVLLRFAHLYESSAPQQYSSNATVALATLFAGRTVTAVQEMSLIANQGIEQIPSFTYNMEGSAPVTLPILPPAPTGNGISVSLSPMQIRTFLATIQ